MRRLASTLRSVRVGRNGDGVVAEGTKCAINDTDTSAAIPAAAAGLNASAAPEASAAQPLTFRQLQDEQRPWVARNFPGREAHYPLRGAVEELDELAHAHLKELQGIRGTAAEHKAKAKAKDAVADTIIFLADYCSARGFDLQEIVEQTWAKVRQRDWRADPKGGGEI